MLNPEKQLYELIANPLHFFDEAKRMDKKQYRHILRTQISSFGYSEVYDRDLSKDLVNQWIREIAQDFDLVMIMEYFDYSLALMERVNKSLLSGESRSPI